MLDERKAAILRAVVEEYIETAQPVGSGHVASAPGVNVSSATVRNEMAVLEQEGYLVQPHTSAGRVPTDKGYRFFVDNLARPGALDAARTPAGAARSSPAPTASSSRCCTTPAGSCADLTDYAAVVVGPAARGGRRSGRCSSSRWRRARSCSSRSLSNGAVEKHHLELDRRRRRETAVSAATRPPRHAPRGSRGARRWRRCRRVGDPPSTPCAGRPTRRSWTPPGRASDQVYVGGASQMAAAFDAVETVREVLADPRAAVRRRVAAARRARPRPERRHRHRARRRAAGECSVVVAPYEVDGEAAGTIGVLGPTRMNYPQALAAVAVVSKRLGRRLTDG